MCIRDSNSPRTPAEEPPPRFVKAIQKKTYVEYLLDLFLYESEEEQKAWIAEHTAEITHLERRLKSMAENKPTNRERLREITDCLVYTSQDNVGVESAHKSEEAVETGAYLVREGYRSHKLKPYRKAAQAERQLEKANVNVLYQKSLQENPQFSSNPLSRWQQKQAIKKQYAAAKHAGQTAGNTAQAASKTGKAARTVKEKAQQAGAFIMHHKKGQRLITIEELAHLVIERTGSRSAIEFVPYEKAYAKGFEDMQRRMPDTAAIHALTGWKPERSLEEVIDDVRDSLKGR